MLIDLDINMTYLEPTEMNMYDLLAFELFRMVNRNEIRYRGYVRCFKLLLDGYQLVND